MRHILQHSKVAIVYRGHYYRPGSKPSNAFNCLHNHAENIHSLIPEKDIYLHTYTGKDDTKLIDMLKPVNYIIQSEPPGVRNKIDFKPYSSRVNTLIQANKLFDAKDYDYILNLRFDLQVNAPVYMWPLDPVKFNTLHPERSWSNWHAERKSSDLIYFYPASMHDDYTQSVKELHRLENRAKLRYGGYNNRESRPVGWSHWITKHMEHKIGLDNIHIMYPVPYYSGKGPDAWLQGRPCNPMVHINRKFE